MSINTKFMTKTQKELNDNLISTTHINKLKLKEEKKAKTLLLKSYGGKRFLGLTKAGKPVFVSYEFNLSDLKLKMSFSHQLRILTEEGAKLANDRYTFEMKTRPNISFDLMTRKLDKKRGGEVTIQTLNYLQRLYELIDINFHKGFVKDKPTKLMFKYIADAIYVGTDVTQHDIMDYCNLPESIYFVPEGTWSYPDEL